MSGHRHNSGIDRGAPHLADFARTGNTVTATVFGFHQESDAQALHAPVLVLNASYEPINVCGARRAIVHFYNSTNPLQRRAVFGLEKPGIIDIATSAAALARNLEKAIPDTVVRYEYSPESFTLTEPDFAVEVCEAVMDVIEPDNQANKIILNLPATVECYTPNVYGDVIEWFLRTIRRRDQVMLSLHPHNDRGCGVAAAEFGVQHQANGLSAVWGQVDQPLFQVAAGLFGLIILQGEQPLHQRQPVSHRITDDVRLGRRRQDVLACLIDDQMTRA